MSETRYIGDIEVPEKLPFDLTVQRYGVTSIAVILLVECGLFLGIPPATEYETSLVTALPFTFWLCFYAVLAGGILILVASAATESGYWKHGLALVLANYMLFFFLPRARGYRFYGQGTSDAFIHVGDVKLILSTGVLPDQWYPAEHVLMSELTMLGVPLESVTYVSAILFTAINIVGIGVLVGIFTGERKGFIAGMAAGCPLIFSTFHLTSHPSVNSFMLVPVLLLVLERYRQTSASEFLALFLLLIVCLIYFHPMTSLFVIAIVFAFSLYTQAHGFLAGASVETVSLRLAAIPLPLLFAWLVNFDQTKYKTRDAFLVDDPPPIATEIEQATAVNFTPGELFGKFVTLYGAQVLYTVVAGAFAIFVVRQFLSNNGRFEWGLTTTQFALGTGIAVVFLFRSLIVAGRIRAGRVAILFAALLVGMVLLYALRSRKVSLTVLLMLVVLVVAGLGANAAYEPNQHTTYAEYDGTQFLVANYELGADIHAMGTRDGIENFVLGSDHPQVTPPGFDSRNEIPPELGYISPETTAADTFGQGYLVTKTHDVKQHTADYFTEEQKKLQYRYGPRHIERLHRDSTANKIYANGGFTAWSITPTERDTSG